MNEPFDTEWADEARLTFDRLPVDVQASFIHQLPQLVSNYANLYHRRPAKHQVVGTVSHLQIPDWGLWLRMDSEYVEDEEGPILFINELEELSKIEAERSLAQAHQLPGRINPPK